MKTDLLQYGLIKKILLSRRFIFILRLGMVFLFILIIYAGLFGGMYRNLATVLTGIIWLAVISLLVLFLGKIWCLVCPWNTIAEWVQQKGFQATESARSARDNEITSFVFSLNLKYPRWLERMSLPVCFLVLLILLEYAVGITNNPRLTVSVALFILTAAVVSAVIFRRKSFCRYACPVGAISGLYALLAPLGLRSNNKEICRLCQSKDCINGNKYGRACPVFEYPGEMNVNTYCTLCTECLHTCPKDNISINLSTFGGDLTNPPNSKSASEEFFIILLLGLMTLHSFFTGSRGLYFTGIFTEQLGLNDRWISVLLVLFIVLSTAGGTYIIRNLFQVKLIYLLIPLAAFYNLALTVKHFLANSEKIGPALVDPFGWNRLFLGITVAGNNPPVVPGAGYLPIILITLGMLWALYFIIKKTELKFTKIILVVFGLFLWYALNIYFLGL